GFGCSAALIGMSTLLTAAHCVDPMDLGVTAITGITATFLNFSTYTAASWLFNPLFNGDLYAGNDIGIIQLSTAVAGLSPYSLYLGLGFGATADVAGYGMTATGNSGEIGGVGTFRHGENQFDATVNSAGTFLSGTDASKIFVY